MRLPRLFAYGRLRLRPRHRVPTLSAVDVCNDGPPFHTVSRWYQISWLGLTLNLDMPTNRTTAKRAWQVPSMRALDAFERVMVTR